MKYRIGIFGSAVAASSGTEKAAMALGKILSEHPVTLVTGACEGLPDIVVAAARANNRSVPIEGYSSFCSVEDQKRGSHAHVDVYTNILYIPHSMPFSQAADVCRKYRNVLSTASCDAGIIISGRWGTLNEFTNLIDFGKVIGVLTGTGGVSDQLHRLQSTISKPTTAAVLFDDDPRSLVVRIIKELGRRNT